jgi:hypothetical protein
MPQERTLRGTRIRLIGVNVNRPRRTLDELVLGALPALAHRVYALREALPVRSRLRRFLTVRLAEQAAAAANRRDFDLLFTGFDPEIDYHTGPSVR